MLEPGLLGAYMFQAPVPSTKAAMQIGRQEIIMTGVSCARTWPLMQPQVLNSSSMLVILGPWAALVAIYHLEPYTVGTDTCFAYYIIMCQHESKHSQIARQYHNKTRRYTMRTILTVTRCKRQTVAYCSTWLQPLAKSVVPLHT